MYAQVNLFGTAWLLLLKHIALVLVVQELDNWLPGIAVVDVVSEARGINDGETYFYLVSAACPRDSLLARSLTLEELLLELCLGDFNLHSLVNLLGVATAVIGVVLDRGREQGVDKRSLAKSRLSCDHYGEGSSTLCNDLVTLVGKLVRCQQLLNIEDDDIRTLAMPIGDADSAMPNVQLGSVTLRSGILL